MIKFKGNSYSSLSEILSLIPQDNEEDLIIDLEGSRIYEQIVIDKPHVTIKNGEIAYDLGAYEILEDGYKRGTFRTYTLFVDADHVSLINVSVKNENGYHNGQAIALMIDGDGFLAKDCVISSYQDTLFLAPLPEKEYEARGFIGPLKDRERLIRKARFENCRVEGSIDFIFGGGLSFFENCEIRSLDIQKEINGYVCAPNTPEDQEYGFIFDHCAFTSEQGMEDSVYLARPWRDHAKCLITNSKIGAHIKAEGYHDWDKPQAHELTAFKEYNNDNQNPPQRVVWMKETTETDLNFIDSLIKEEK